MLKYILKRKGAIHLKRSLTDASFEGNSAINDGGSIWAIIHSNLTINSMKIIDSKAISGGGIYMKVSGYSSISDSQFKNI